MSATTIPPRSPSASFGTGATIDAARTWLDRAVDGVDGDDDHHPFPGFREDAPFRSGLRLDGPVGKIPARDVSDLTREGLRRRDGFDSRLESIDAHLQRLSELSAPPNVVFIALPAELTRRYWSVRSFGRGVETIWNLRAGIKARAMQRGIRTQLINEATTTSRLDEHTGTLEHPADRAWNLFVGLYFKAGGFPWRPIGLPEGTCDHHMAEEAPHELATALRQFLRP